MEKHRLINFRSFLIIAASLVFAAIFALLSFTVQWLGWLLFGVSLVVLFSLVFISLYRGDKKFKTLTFAVCIVLFITVFFNFIATVNLWNKDDLVEDELYSVSGTVDSVHDVDDKVVIILRNVSVADEKHRGKIKVYAAFEPKLTDLSVGDRVVMSSVRLYKNELIDGGRVNAYNKRTNIRYTVNAFVGDINAFEGKPNFTDKLSESIRDLLVDTMGSTYGNTAYGMLTGDKSGIAEETTSAFDLSGISHVLAVSGLHIGFIAAVITFIMRKCKARRLPIFTVVTVFLLFYMFVADFSPSVIRAVAMTETVLAADVFGRRKDRLSALCFAVCVILTFSPLYLFETGFQMSVGAVFGIILFADAFEKALRKIRIPKFIASPVGTSFAVQIGIFPSLIYGLGKIQIYSVFANVVLMPFIAVTFCAVFVSMILAWILPFMGFMLKISSWGLWIVDKGATAIGTLPYAVVPMPSTAAIFLAYPAYFSISRFLMLEKAKYPVKIPLVLLCGVLFVHGMFALPPYELKSVIIPISDTSSVTTVIGADGKIYVAGDMFSYFSLRETLKKYRVTVIEAVYMTELDEKSARTAVKLFKEFDVKAFYSPQNETIDGLGLLTDGKVDNYYMLGDGSEENWGKINAVFSGGEFVCYSLDFSGGKALFFGYDADYAEADVSLINSAAVIRSFSYSEKFSDRLFIVNESLSSFVSPPRGFSVSDEPESVFDYENGEYLTLPT